MLVGNIMPADEICMVDPKVADEVVKRSFQKRGTIREHQEIGLQDTVPTDADRSDSVLPFLKGLD
jgi:hypothetical protein